MVNDIFAYDNISCIYLHFSARFVGQSLPWSHDIRIQNDETTCKNPPPPWVVPCQLVVLHLSSSIPVFTDFVGISSWFLGPNQVIKVWKGWLFQENSRTSSIDFCGSKMVRQLAALKGQIPSKKHRFYDLLVPPLDFLKMYWKWCESTHIYAANLQLGQNQIGAEMSCIWNYQKLSMIDIDKFETFIGFMVEMASRLGSGMTYLLHTAFSSASGGGWPFWIQGSTLQFAMGTLI